MPHSWLLAHVDLLVGCWSRAWARGALADQSCDQQQRGGREQPRDHALGYRADPPDAPAAAVIGVTGCCARSVRSSRCPLRRARPAPKRGITYGPIRIASAICSRRGDVQRGHDRAGHDSSRSLDRVAARAVQARTGSVPSTAIPAVGGRWGSRARRRTRRRRSAPGSSPGRTPGASRIGCARGDGSGIRPVSQVEVGRQRADAVQARARARGCPAHSCRDTTRRRRETDRDPPRQATRLATAAVPDERARGRVAFSVCGDVEQRQAAANDRRRVPAVRVSCAPPSPRLRVLAVVAPASSPSAYRYRCRGAAGVALRAIIASIATTIASAAIVMPPANSMIIPGRVLVCKRGSMQRPGGGEVEGVAHVFVER